MSKNVLAAVNVDGQWLLDIKLIEMLMVNDFTSRQRRVVVLVYIMFCCFGLHAQRSISSVTKLTTDSKQFKKTEFDILISGSFVNPYDSKDIAVDMIITSPTAKTIKLPCYYVSGDATLSTWKARFTPRESGVYAYHFEVSKNSVVEANSVNNTFAVDATAYKGFLHKNNNWSFKFDNGNIFRGVGENFGWEPRASEQGGYKGTYTYRYLLPKLAANGVNFFRTWMSPWNLPLEWKQVTNTTRYTGTDQYFNPGGIAKMDSLVNQCDSLGLYMMLTLDYHGALCFNWNLSNYNSVNGGPIAQPAAFFTNSTAKSMYKDRLRYLIARWGYSASIGAFEFFNEIDNAMYTESNGGLPRIPDADVTSWHGEMSTYLKSLDPYEHLVTTSISYREVTGMNALPNIDFNQKHIYEDPYVSQIDQNIDNGTTAFSKPYVIGEYGYRYQDDNYSQYAFNYDYDFKLGLWLGLFKPTPILPMSWWWEMFDAKAGKTKYFRAVSEIYNDMMTAVGQAGTLAQVNVSSSFTSQKVLAVRAGNKYYVYILNPTGSSVTVDVKLTTNKNVNYVVQTYNPVDGDNATYTTKGTLTATGNSLNITSNAIESNRERILIISEDGNISGIQLPYTTATAIPGTLEMENYDKGGENLAYHDFETANLGGQYRTDEGVDIETCSAGGFNISNTLPGEWVEYTLDVQKGGIYNLDVVVATLTSNKQFHLLIDDVEITDAIKVNTTGGSQTWENITVQTRLINKGLHTLRLLLDDAGINFDKIKFTLVHESPEIDLTNPKDLDQYEQPVTISIQAEASDADGNISKVEFFANSIKIGEALVQPYTLDWSPLPGTYSLYAVATDDDGLSAKTSTKTIILKPSSIQTPFPDAEVPHAIPGKIEAEDADTGSEGIAYHDLTPTNIKGQYRSDVGFDIEACSDAGGGYNLADIQAAEWVEYSIMVNKTGKYDFSFRVATQMSAQSFTVLMNNNVVIELVSVPNTGNWQTWKDATVKGVSLNEGSAVLRLLFNSEFFNLNYFNVTESSVVTDVDHSESQEVIMYPNPSNDEINLILPPSAKEIQIVSLEGHLVYRQEVHQSHTLISNTFAAGMYLVVIKHNSGRIEYKKALIRPSSH